MANPGDLRKNAKAVAGILQQCFEPGTAEFFAAFLVVTHAAAEFDDGAAFGLRARQTRTFQIVGAVLNVGAKFLGQVVVDARTVKEASGERTKISQEFHIPSRRSTP
jgi:hypothetical protein